jgi:L-iditol 2-dehydrogenase
MKALVYTGPKALEMRDVSQPVAGDGDVLIKIDSVGICGSDMHAWAGHDERRPAPLILGHEAAGTIVEGPDAGRRVTVNPLVTCGTCSDCRSGRTNLCGTRQIISMPPREGGFAEYLSMPLGNLVTVDDAISLEKAALAEPIACGWHAVRLAERAMQPALAESTCLVLGGGAIGLGAALVLAHKGAREIWIAETNPVRRKILDGLGDFQVFDPMAGAGPAAGSVDLVVDGVGFEATRAHASRAVRPGGVIAHIGLGSAEGGLDIRRITLQEITFFGTYTYTVQDFKDTAHAIFEGRLGPLDWCEVRPLKDGARAFDEIGAGKVAAPKIILKP